MSEAELSARITRLEARLAELITREGIATVKPWTPISGGVVYVDASGTGALTTEAAFTYDSVNDELIYGRGRLTEQATPGTPVNPYAILFANSVGTLSGIDDAGIVKQMVRYEENTWVPTYVGGTTAGVTTYSTQSGQYTRIGDMCFARGVLVWTNATGTGQVRISLPFASAAASFTGGAIYIDAVTFTTTTPLLLNATGNSYAILASPASNAGSAVLAIETAGTIVYDIFYKI